MNQVEPSRGSKASFTEGSIKRHVLHLSTVMILGFFAMTAGGLLEMFYIGMVGKLELAAITFMFPISMSLLSLTRGIGVGASSLIAQSMGQGDRQALRSLSPTPICPMLCSLPSPLYCWAS